MFGVECLEVKRLTLEDILFEKSHLVDSLDELIHIKAVICFSNGQFFKAFVEPHDETSEGLSYAIVIQSGFEESGGCAYEQGQPHFKRT